MITMLSRTGAAVIMRNNSCDKWQQKACLKVMKKEQVVDQKLSQLVDFPTLSTSKSRHGSIWIKLKVSGMV
jgi:hypothetical protein